MSYDLRIRYDDRHSRTAAFDELHSFIATLPHMSLNGRAGFVYGDGRTHHMEIDLEFKNAEGDCEPPRDNQINCVNCHIPYAFLDIAHDTDPTLYFDVCKTIAKHLGWGIYDPQSDEYL